jgi:ketosteroid isomerase-like protein
MPSPVFDRWYAAHETGDLAGLRAVLDPDVTVHSLFRPEPVHTRDAAVAHFLRTTTTFSDLAMALVSTPAAAADGAVLGEVVFTGSFTGGLAWRNCVHRGKGQRFQVPGVVVVRTRSGAVTSVRTLYDRDDWLRQIAVPSC